MTSVVAPDAGEPEPNEEPSAMAHLRLEFEDKAVDVRGPSNRLAEISDSMTLAVAAAGGAAGPTLALGTLPGGTPAWVTGSVVGAQLLYLAYVVTTIFMRRRKP